MSNMAEYLFGGAAIVNSGLLTGIFFRLGFFKADHDATKARVDRLEALKNGE